MTLSAKYEQWVSEAVRAIMASLASVDGTGHFDTFRYAEDGGHDGAPPAAVIDEAVHRLQAKGVKAARDDWMIVVSSPYKSLPSRTP